MNKDFYTVREIPLELEVNEQAVRYLIKNNKLNATKVFGKWIRRSFSI